VRVTDMRGVDVARYPFDTDLTFAVLLMHPNGHVYHRYGGRDHRSASTWLSLASFERVLEATLEEHEAAAAPPHPPEPVPPVRTEELPAFAAKDRGECIHCHSVRPSIVAGLRPDRRLRPEDVWRHPPPGRIGLDLDRDDQQLVTAVAAGSVAERAGLRVGDRVLGMGPGVILGLDSLGRPERSFGFGWEQRILTASDVAWVLDRLPGTEKVLLVRVARDGEEWVCRFELADGWKVGTPLEYSWRPFKWDLTTRVGFGGKDLTADEKAELGLAPDAFAFRVQYLVDWGEFRRFGAAAKAAGIAKGDVVVGADGRRDFAGEPHFQAWYRLTHAAGDVVRIERLRDGERRTATLTVLE
jgi:hypothetical protein